MKSFFHAALGAEDHAFPAESRAESGAARLKQNGDDKQNRDGNLGDIDDEFQVHNTNSISDMRRNVKIFSVIPAKAGIQVVYLLDPRICPAGRRG